MRLCRTAALALSLVALMAAYAHGLAGVGRKSVEAALGRVPQTPDELRNELDAAAAILAGDPDDLDANYRQAVLALNDPKGVKTATVRAALARIVARDPDYKDAFALWDDLVPAATELAAVDASLEGRDDAQAHYVRAWIAVWEGRYPAVAALAEVARDRDPAYTARTAWLETVASCLAGKDGPAGEFFARATEDPDDEAARLMSESARLAASPSEMEGWERVALADRGIALRSFWRRRDPLPLTPINERLGEHIRRVYQARREFALDGAGNGYLTQHSIFKNLSPDLGYYASDLVYRYMERARPWIDHRGLIYVRYGASDRLIREGGAGARSETWFYRSHTPQAMLFHFIERRGVGQAVLTLNLAQALATGRIEDDPSEILANTSDFREIYDKRANVHPIFSSVANARTRYELEGLLVQEAQFMAGFIKTVWFDDASELFNEKNLLPFAAYTAGFLADDGCVDLYAYYAIPEEKLKTTATTLTFGASFVLYTHDWLREVRRIEHSFVVERPAEKTGTKRGKDNFFVGVLPLYGLDPGRYRYAFELREESSGKFGVSKGLQTVKYFGRPWVELSDLVLAEDVTPIAGGESRFERNGVRVIPIPTRVVRRSRPARFYYEIYDLDPDPSGVSHYSLDYKILKIQGQQGIGSTIFGIGMNVASVFFPYYTFLAQAGMFGVQQATTGKEEGLTRSYEEHEANSPDGHDTRVFALEPAKMDRGLYEFYVTVRDLSDGSTDLQSFRFAVTD